MQFDPKLPIYVQIAGDIRDQILSGTIKEGAKLPSVRQLCQSYEVTSLTAQRATAYLEQGGITEPRKGVGSFVKTGVVAALRAESRREVAQRYVESMQSMGFGAKDIRAAIEEVLADG